jgi:ABC-type multidrug transport system fused ATPase/permease subunit
LIPLLNFIGEYSSGLLKRRVEIDLMAEILRSSTRREVDKSEVLARISGDLMNAMGAAYTPFDVAFQLMRFSVYFVLAWHFSPTLALAVLPFVAAYFVVVWRLGPKIFEYSALERERYSEVYKWVKETVDGSHSLRRLGVCRLPAPLLAAFNGWLAATKRQILYLKGVEFGAQSIAYAAPQFTIAYGLYLATQGTATVGAVLAASRAVSLLFETVAIIISEAASYMQFTASY